MSAAALIAAAGVVLTTLSPEAVQGAASTAPGTYVALGDSLSAGPKVPTASTDGCQRSDHNFPALVSASIGRRLVDTSCTGARTSEMLLSQFGTNPLPRPQFNKLSRNVQVVTLTIGGNDIGFGDIALACVRLFPVFVTPCQNNYVHDGGDDVSNAISATAPKVAAVLDGIHQRSPRARVYLVGYPPIVPDSGDGIECWPDVPIAYADVPWLRAKVKELNAMLQTQAVSHNATYVDTYGPFIGHDACQGFNRWMEPIITAVNGERLHPNATGHAQIANVVTAAINNG